MNKFIRLLLSAAVTTSIAGCGSAPAESEAAAQRSRAEKAQSELGTDAAKQKAESEKHRD